MHMATVSVISVRCSQDDEQQAQKALEIVRRKRPKVSLSSFCAGAIAKESKRIISQEERST
jgi:hypothetical protein